MWVFILFHFGKKGKMSKTVGREEDLEEGPGTEAMSSIREITSLPLSRSVIDDLLKHGFRVISDFNGMKPLELSQEVKSINPETALTILQCIQKCKLEETNENNLPKTMNSSFLSTTSPISSSNQSTFQTTAKDILEKMALHRPIITFCKEVDLMLGGGIPIGQITEFCGVPGVSHLPYIIYLCILMVSPSY
jgi:hypothetical protein